MGTAGLVLPSHGAVSQVDLGHLYGDNLQRQHQLRLFRDGKLKFQVPRGTMCQNASQFRASRLFEAHVPLAAARTGWFSPLFPFYHPILVSPRWLSLIHI